MDGRHQTGGRAPVDRRRRLALVVLGAGSLVVSATPPALAHATFAGPATYPTDTDQRLTLEVPEERGDTAHNVGVDVFVPADWPVLGCETSPTWSCDVGPGAADGRTLVRWTKEAGSPPHPSDVAFVFSVHTGPPARVAFPVIQRYPNEEVRWIGGPGDEEPAPVVESVAGPAPSPTTTTTTVPADTTTTRAPGAATTTTSAGPGTTRPTTTTTRTAPSTTATTAAGGSAALPPTTEDRGPPPPTSIPDPPGDATGGTGLAGSPAERSGGSAGSPLLAGGIALVAGGLMVVVGRRRRARRP